MKRVLICVLAILFGIIIIVGGTAVGALKKYHDENTFADIEVITKGRSLDPYEESYVEKTFSDTCIKGTVIELEPKDYTITVMKVNHDGSADIKINSRGGLISKGIEYKSNDVITLREGETNAFNEEVTDAEFIIEVKVLRVYYR